MSAETEVSPVGPGDQMTDSAEQGRICARAAKGQRDLTAVAAAYPELFPPRPFDATLFGDVAMAIAFCAPWCDLDRLRAAHRAVLWGFAVDRLIDHEARSRDEIDRLAVRCLAVVDGATPQEGDQLGALLAELRDELATVPAFAAHRERWREETRKVLDAMAREWDWQQSPDTRPGFAEYLDNAASLACTVVNVVHWIHGDDPATLAHLDALLAASDQVQRILRLVDDLGTYERDLRRGDLNALLLVSRAEVEKRIAVLVAEAREQLATLRVDCPVAVDHLARQIGFSSGFHRSTDFWGTP
ncbi:terpene synthase family protein [Micromonospora sp. NPDC049900]|uniref:terpene synthase family protein n=1 Tax=unclassified Micromonospora TaxID=2617518 RepID=UPI0037985A14